MELTPLQAGLFSFVSLAVAWLLYEAACRSGLARHETAFALGGYVFLVGLTYAFTHVLSGRGAFNQIGAIIGTIMVANVFATIIPNQKKIVAALLKGETPDPALGEAGKLRSVHNNYLTLPVIVLMISNHYPLLFATRYNWLIVAVVLALGPVIRHFFNSRHAGKPSPWWVWGVAAAGMLVILWLSGAGPRQRPPARCRQRRLSPRSRTSSPPAAACATPPSRSGKASAPRRRAWCWTRPSTSGVMRA